MSSTHLTNELGLRQLTFNDRRFFRRLRVLADPRYPTDVDDGAYDLLPMYLCLVKTLLNSFISREDGMEIGALMALYKDVYGSPIFDLPDANERVIAKLLSAKRFRKHFIARGIEELRICLPGKKSSLAEPVDNVRRAYQSILRDDRNFMSRGNQDLLSRLSSLGIDMPSTKSPLEYGRFCSSRRKVTPPVPPSRENVKKESVERNKAFEKFGIVSEIRSDMTVLSQDKKKKERIRAKSTSY